MTKQKPISTAVAAESRSKKDGFHATTSPGLYLRVNGQSASWVLRIMRAGKRNDIRLGAYQGLKLADATSAAAIARARVKNGLPALEPVIAPPAAVVATGLTFAEACERYLAKKLGGFRNAKHRQQWRNTLTTYAVPPLGLKPALKIKRRDVVTALTQLHEKGTPLWLAVPETASRLRGRIEEVLAYAASLEDIDGPEFDNPAALTKTLKHQLPTRPPAPAKNYPRLPVADAAAFMAWLKPKQGQSIRALEFLILTAVRSGDVRGALWTEIRLEDHLWVIPPERLKVKTRAMPLRVPLSAPALAVLAVQEKQRRGPLVFPSTSGKPLSDMALSQIMRDAPFMADDPYSDRKPTPHGWRSTFKDWAREQGKANSDVVEECLAHKNPDKVEAAYGRSDLLELRRALMQQWAEFLQS